MVPKGFQTIPDWFSVENQGAGVAIADVTGNGKPDLIVLMVDNPPGPNRGVYRIGRDLDPGGAVTGGWTPWIDVPDWFSAENQGAGVAVADVTGNGKLDLVVFMVDNPPGQNRGLYRIGRDLDAGGAVTGGWTPWIDVPDWFSWENQGAGIALADVNGNGKQDLVVLMVDNPPGLNQAKYRVGRDLDAGGAVTGGWTPWVNVPEWFSWENQGAGVAVADIDGNGKPDVIVFGIDNPPGPDPALPSANPSGQNQAYYIIGRDIQADGTPAAGWSSLLGVNNWFSWDNQYGGIAVFAAGGRPQLLIMAVDNPPGVNTGFYTLIPLSESPDTHGKWELLPFNSEVLAIHAAVLRTGKVLFFAGSGNNTHRVADPNFGNVKKNMWTSVVWDPTAPQGANFSHPATIKRADKKPFDFFCGGDTVLPDGSVLSAGGNQSYNNGNNLGQRDVAAFDPQTEQWAKRAPMAEGRWYPTLLPLADGRVLAVSGKNGTDGQLNQRFEVYDPGSDTWTERHPPHDPNFVGLPFYAHLFLLADGRVFFSGGRMDDDRPQQAGILDLGHNPIGFQPVPANETPTFRNQSASVLLAPAQDQQVMIIGGGPINDVTSATGSTERVALNQPQPHYQQSMPLSLPRMHLNAVLLPDRTVFVSGGAMTHEETGKPPTARLQSETYDPATDTWRSGAVASVIRMYHSIALLLPDGRVVTASGNPPPYGQLPQWLEQPNEELKIEVYSPPYLFAGPRPTIANVATEWTYGQPVTIGTPQAGNIRWAQLIRNGVTTHSFDNSQRLVDLPIGSQAQAKVNVTAPPSPTVAPPGWYMLFLVDNGGVPSVATWIHVA
jgi:hypothetical protein